MSGSTSYFLDIFLETLLLGGKKGKKAFFMGSRKKYFVTLVLLSDNVIGTQALF